ncbi:MAG: arabinose isomerase [Ruminococcaceae bacterium]|nr:arabinose isomerase [Oscillospiraceae bacterium]
MLVNTKARIGVFSIALGAYLPQFPSLVPEFEEQYEAFKKTLPDTVEIIDGGIVTTKELAMAAGDKFRAADVDLVILQMLTYATSYNMLPAIRDLDVPVVVVNVQKLKAPDYANTDIPKWLGELYACGAVGEAVADLERAGKRHAVITGVVEGGDPYVAQEIEAWCRAAQVRRRFRDTNIAQIGRPYPGMMDLYIDETNLYNRMFLYTKQFDWEKMWAIADNITDEAAIRAKAEDILNTFDIEGGATVETVWEMAKYVVAFEKWVDDEQLGLIASHYDGFATGKAGVLDSMLIPAFSMLIKQGTACAVEGDIKVAMAMSILKTIAGTGQLSEMYSIDFNEDICIIGHSGSGDADISTAKKPTMKIVPVFHGKTGGGYLTQFYPPVGEITYLAITQDKDGNFKFIVAEGVNEEGPIFMFGDTNMRTRFTCGAREFCNRWSEAGPTHHMAAATGRHIDTILKVAKILNVPCEIVTR